MHHIVVGSLPRRNGSRHETGAMLVDDGIKVFLKDVDQFIDTIINCKLSLVIRYWNMSVSSLSTNIGENSSFSSIGWKKKYPVSSDGFAVIGIPFETVCR